MSRRGAVILLCVVVGIALIASVVFVARGRSALRGRIHSLIGSLGDPEDGARGSAAKALGEIGPAAERALPTLATSALNDPSPSVRAQAARALGLVGPEAPETVPTLLKVLANRDPSVRRQASETLGLLGPKAKPALPDLDRLSAKDPDPSVRSSALDALEKIRK